MKSILVDALRQANDNESEPKLADSGRFDTTEDDFAETANQEMIDASNGDEDADLELMSTTKSLVVSSGDAQADELPPERVGETMASAAVLLTGGDRVVPDSSSLPPMPRLARHVPMLCAVLAVIAAIAWQGYQRLELRPDASSLGAVALQSIAPEEAEDQPTADVSEQRFRYLDGALPTSGDEDAP